MNHFVHMTFIFFVDSFRSLDWFVFVTLCFCMNIFWIWIFLPLRVILTPERIFLQHWIFILHESFVFNRIIHFLESFIAFWEIDYSESFQTTDNFILENLCYNLIVYSDWIVLCILNNLHFWISFLLRDFVVLNHFLHIERLYILILYFYTTFCLC